MKHNNNALCFPAVENIKSPQERKVMCYPIQLACPAPRIPPTMVTSNVDGETTTIRYMRDSLKINTTHMFKLVSWVFMAYVLLTSSCMPVLSYGYFYFRSQDSLCLSCHTSWGNPWNGSNILLLLRQGAITVSVFLLLGVHTPKHLLLTNLPFEDHVNNKTTQFMFVQILFPLF